ncbi:MAG: single-stranded-DNA-specific exonuclease RecJ [Gammaproteobacteria bacterium]|nr:MAG: single-stranded-DNA-specific exonuclease RecJ [Gammaproteobacteria bacterium]
MILLATESRGGDVNAEPGPDTRWTPVIRRREVVNEAALPADLPRVLRRVYAARGVTDGAELERSLNGMIPPDRMTGAREAARLLADLIERGGRLLVVGDFDADGATSCALCLLAIRAMGHAEVDFLVPNRFDYGYGMTPEIVELARERAPDLILTVDNGISSIAGVAAANAAGIPVIVTDHHLPGSALPTAAAIVNPNAPDNEFPSKAAAGVGVAFYVLLALRAELQRRGWFEGRGLRPPNMAQFLDLVALGTVADVVPLDRNNRILVHQGLMRIRAGDCRPGILALLEAAGRDHRRVQAADMGFAVGPRLNAAGRLDDMTRGIACLLAESIEEARPLARELDGLNRDRRRIEQEMQEEAERILAGWLADEDSLAWGLCLFREDWHQGVIGILASRIKERYHRPVIAFAAAGDDTLKGSARSIPGLHIRDALDRVAARHPRLLQKFGGHAMAAGMSIAREDFEAFSRAFDEVVRELLDPEALQPLVDSDGAIPAEELNLETARLIADAGPWGQAFPEPLFDDCFEIRSGRIVGERHWKLLLHHPESGQSIDGIAFNAVERHPRLPQRARVAYRLDVNEWRGQVALQLRIEHMEPA